jgi:hypothetical protein
MIGPKRHTRLALLLAMVGAVAPTAQARYLETEAFLGEVFGGTPPDSAVMLVDAETRRAVEDILGHRFAPIRLRYWHRNDTTAWIIDEIGKAEPITIGVAIRAGRVQSVRILEFRESRGWEVRYPFFTDQFTGRQLTTDAKLDRPIDGITGATLSVTAVTRVTRIALLLHAKVEGSTRVAKGP